MKVYDEFGEHRSFSDMDSFVRNLKKRCSPSNLDLCEERTRIKIETFLEMEFSILKQKIADIEKTISEAKLGYLKAIEDFDAYYKTFLESCCCCCCCCCGCCCCCCCCCRFCCCLCWCCCCCY